MELKHLILIILGLVFTASCSNETESDAYGQFEAEEIVISAEANGRLLNFDVEEGDKLEKGLQVGTVDTTNLHLQKNELEAAMESVRSNINKLDAQRRVLQTQLETAQKELNRLQALQKDNAATQQQLDTAEGQVNTLRQQIDAIEVDKQSVSTELTRMEAKIAQINHQIEQATILNPVNGTVLSSFAEEHELVSMGKPLYRIANLDEMILRVYITGAQLPDVQLGETVEVLFDQNAEENYSVNGEVSWVASEAEFT
ncbi:MAG: HlyD family efflux transporter periplasmic adaptor subunit, partial [Balneolaceae bacterium]|nr:HlyD family efflux transporter periplasmic adaptor subunit [Balneolaceae bacterium]